MKKFFVAIVVMSLVLASMPMVIAPVGAPPQEASAGAGVTVNEYVSLTISTCSPLNFGAGVDPGATDVAITCQSVDGVSQVAAIGLTADAITNVALDINVRGTDFTYSGSTIPVTAIEYDDDADMTNDPDTISGTTICPSDVTHVRTGLTASYVEYWDNVKTGASAWTCGLWYWMDVPGGYLPAGAYTGNLDVQADKHV